jgi:hypothetical protein
MKAALRGPLMVTCFNSLRINTGVIASLFVVSTVLIALVGPPGAFGQAASPSNASTSGVGNHDQPYAPLGQSGYKVPLPEIKLNQIFGGQRPKQRPTPPEADESAAPQPETPGPTEQGESEQPDQRETSVVPGAPRLPFDHAILKRGPRAIPEKGPAEESSPASPLPKESVFPLAAPAAPEDLMVARPPKKEVFGKRIPPGAPPLLEAQPLKQMLKTIPLKAQEAPRSGPVEGIPLGTRGDPEIVPAAEPEPEPVPAVSAAPEPELSPIHKERTPVPAESYQDKQSAKESAPVAPLPEPKPDVSPPEESAPLMPSPEPKPDVSTPKESAPVAPLPEPKPDISTPEESAPAAPLPEPKPTLSSPMERATPAAPLPEFKLDLSSPKERTPLVPSPEPESDKSTARETAPIVALPKPEPEPEKTPPKEITPSEPPVEPADEQSIPKESLPTFDRSVAPPKEILRSPLDQESPDTPETKHYLRDTAPILEELSLLMTRAPSINVTEFDPSDANAPLFPGDLQLKMDSMKRDLQILDSKTFAIIPPKTYEQFHGLIRDSISQTHQACDAILNYMAEPNEENFKTIQEHLFRARQLIQRTRSHG